MCAVPKHSCAKCLICSNTARRLASLNSVGRKLATSSFTSVSKPLHSLAELALSSVPSPRALDGAPRDAATVPDAVVASPGAPRAVANGHPSSLAIVAVAAANGHPRIAHRRAHHRELDAHSTREIKIDRELTRPASSLARQPQRSRACRVRCDSRHHSRVRVRARAPSRDVVCGITRARDAPRNLWLWAP